MAEESIDRRPPSLMGLSTYLTGRYSKGARVDVQAALAGFELNTQTFGVLAALDDFGALAQQDLAVGLGADKSNVVRLVDELEKRELVRRSPDPADRRRHRVELTTAGSKVIVKVKVAVEKVDSDHLRVLSAAERRTLVSLLQRLLEAQDNPHTPHG